MKKSDLASVIREEFLTLVKEENNLTTELDVSDVNIETDAEGIMKEFIQAVEKAANSDEIFKKFESWVNSFMPGAIQEDTIKVSEDLDDIEDEEKAHKAAAKGARGKDAKGVAAQATAALKKQEKKKALMSFLGHMKDIGVISSDNKVVKPNDYKVHFSHFKTNPEDYI